MKETFEMNKIKKLSGIYLFILFIAITVPTALRTVALLRNFNYGSGYFEGGKVYITAAGITLSALTVLLLTFAFTVQMPEKLRASFNSPATYIPVGAVGAALVFFAANSYLKLKSLGAPVVELLKVKNAAAISGVILTALSVAACVFFVANALITDRASLSRAFFGICTVIFLLFYFGYLYFNNDLPINAPNKVIDELAYISAAAFFLFETRISLEREFWKSYVAFGFVAAVMTAYSSIPSVIVYFTNAEIISNSIFETALTLTLFIFILSRTVLALNLPEDRDSELVLMIKKFASERAATLEERHAIEKRAYLEVINRFNEVEETHGEPSEANLFPEQKDEENQLSIFDESSYGGLESEVLSDVGEYDTSAAEVSDGQGTRDSADGEEPKTENEASENADADREDDNAPNDEANEEQVSIFDAESEESAE
jgi:hypothetical protein